MLRLTGRRTRHCDRITRRNFLQAGAVGVCGLTLPSLLRAEAATGRGSSVKSVINVHLDGGPPQMDLIDLKSDAPAEYRGEFKGIRTKIPGFRICELLPKVASIADRFAFIRSLVGSAGRHDSFQCQSGFSMKDLEAVGGRPAMGSVVTKLMGSPEDQVPAFVDMHQGRGLVRNSCRPGFLGPSYRPFRPDMNKWFRRPLEPKMEVELANLGANHSTEMTLLEGLDADRLGNRRALLKELDRIRRQVDSSGMMDAMDRFTQQAVSILTSGRFADALDLGKEDPKIVRRYTPGPDTVERFTTSEGPESARKLLLARRLVEAGVRCVSVSISDFDTHSKNFSRMRQTLPIVDTALYALVTDLEERGMLDDVSIVVWGEFGRTPKVNKNGGRDHWPRVGPALLAGGGMKGGQVIGSTDRYAGEVLSRPVQYQDVIATLYHNLGIDPTQVTIVDPSGRPQYLVEHGRPIRELV